MALGLLEVRGFSPGMVILDAMEKAADISLLQVELNDLYGVCFKITGETAAVQAAIAAGKSIADQMQVDSTADVIPSPHPSAQPAYEAKSEFSPLIEQDVVHIPKRSDPMTSQAPFAIGMIETQGFTAVIEAIDTACKAANVEVLGREKLGGGYITVLIKGDVAAVRAAIDAGRTKIEQLALGKLIAAHVIPSPSNAVLSLLPTDRCAKIVSLIQTLNPA